MSVFRALKRLGAASLTPGAAILPYREDLEEQLDWLAQDIDEMGGDAWVLPVTELSELEESRVKEHMATDRAAEYEALRLDALEFLRRAPVPARTGNDQVVRIRTERQLVAFQRRFRKIRARDYVDASGREAVARVIDRCLAFRQGISTKLTASTDEEHP